MKLILLHGAAITSSRAKLVEIKKKFDTNNVIVFDPSINSGYVIASLQTLSMFGEEKLIVVENPQDDLLLNLPPTIYNLPATLVFWFDHELKKLPKEADVLFFPEAKEISVFPFLDKLGMKDKRAFLELDKLKRFGFDSQYVITMIFYLLRNLVATPKGARDFVRSKNEKMRKFFSSDELVDLYKFVLGVDFKIKSGLLEPSQAEFLLVNKFIG